MTEVPVQTDFHAIIYRKEGGWNWHLDVTRPGRPPTWFELAGRLRKYGRAATKLGARWQAWWAVRAAHRALRDEESPACEVVR